MLFKNTASQKVRVYAFDATTGTPKTGDAANITASVSKDFAAVADLADTSATEEDATKSKGYYLFDVSQAETNADDLCITGRSTTANIVVVGAPARIATRPPNAGALSIDASGRVDLGKVAGTAQTALDIGGTWTAARAAHLDADISSRLATAGYTAPPAAAANATAVRTELAVELARVDVAVSSRSTLAAGAAMTLADGAITDAKFTLPNPTTPATGAVGMMQQLWRRFFKRATCTATEIKTYADNGTTVITTQAVSDDSTTQDQGAAT